MELLVGVNPPREFKSGVSGTVTASSCAVGKAAKSGERLLLVNGSAVVALATQTPLWRDLQLREKGEDVKALSRELKRIGAYKGSVTGVVTRALVDSFNKFMTKAGVASSGVDRQSISASRIVWLPSASVRLGKCLVEVGDEIDAGTVLFASEIQVASARVALLPADISPGQHVLDIEGASIPVDDKGAVLDEEGLAAIAGTASFQAAEVGNGLASIQAHFRLVEPIEVSVVPPAALAAVGGSSATCESLAFSDGVEASGALRNDRRGLATLALPNAPLPQYAATPGLVELLGAPPGIGISLSGTVSQRLGIDQIPARLATREGEVTVTGMFAYPEDGRRPGLGYAAVVPTPAAQTYDECWVRVWPATTANVNLVRLAYSPTADSVNQVPKISQLNPVFATTLDTAFLFWNRPTRMSALACVLIGIAIGFTAVWSRRLELASTLHGGMPKTAV
ncbi:MAG: hypothetical protein LBU38_00800, partial [Propionibacteriaceae bacterium]|nr:hypothetical protein [Propionibacteriaceae bacterium]